MNLCIFYKFLFSGTPANQLSISKLTVWALNPEGEILHRLGVSLANRGGDYWKKIPGVFTYLSGKYKSHSISFPSAQGW